jgi:hypothetical protein
MPVIARHARAQKLLERIRLFTLAVATVLGLMPGIAIAQSVMPQATGAASTPLSPQEDEPPSSKPPSRFRQIFACEDDHPLVAKSLGKITGLKTVSFVSSNGKSIAVVKGTLPHEIFSSGFFPVTRLELTPGSHCSTPALAVLAPPPSIEIVPLKESSDESLIQRVERYLDARFKAAAADAASQDERDAISNFKITKAEIFVLSPRYTAVLAHVTHVATSYQDGKYDKEASGMMVEPMLFIVGETVTELTQKARKGYWICDSLISAFKLSNRLHIHVASDGCNNGINGQMTFDLSGPTPKEVFSDWDLSD